MNLTPSAFGREYNYPFKLCKQTLGVVGLLCNIATHVAGATQFFPKEVVSLDQVKE
jgi:hypothetical protein